MGYIQGRSKATDAMRCHAMLCHWCTTPDLDTTSSCDGPAGALAVSQFLGIKSRQYGLNLPTRGDRERGLF